MDNSETKLAINLSEGTVQVEGTEEFVRFIYQDFKDSLSKQVVVRPLPAQTLDRDSPPALLTDETKSRKKRTQRKASINGNGEKPRPAAYKPTFNTKLDLATLEPFFDEWHPENNFEKILVCAVFLRDKLNIAPCTADDIYTCFFTLSKKGKTKVPEAFKQAFIDCHNRTHYIEYKSPQEIQITIPGDNHSNEKKRKEQESR